MKQDPGNTFKTAQSIMIGSKARAFTDSVSSKDKFDLYRFKLSNSSTFKGLLTGLKAKADILLYNNVGQLVKQSTTKPTGKSLSASLKPGTYYVSVTQISGSTPYKLTLSAVSKPLAPPVVLPPPPSIDLTGDRLSAFPSGFIGRSLLPNARNFGLDYSIKNLGNSNVPDFLVSFYLSSNNFISTTDRLLDTYRISNLSGFSTTPTFRANLSLPPAGDLWWFDNPGEGLSSSAIRTYYVGMVIDPINDIAETDENNNSNMGLWTDFSSITISNPAG